MFIALEPDLHKYGNNSYSICTITDTLLQNLETNGDVPSTISDYARTLRCLTMFLQQEQVESFRILKPEYNPLYCERCQLSWPFCYRPAKELRQFFRYLYLNGYHEKDLSLFILESNLLRSREHLPSIWILEDFEKILGFVDIGNPLEK